ncbi:hypothetical protein C8Q74DRAFT_1373701 [Fomes fomentarius]|nr:hypothetical protein C8Q74DRAFT_1373701 [Fomes fomentarius]
MVEQRENLNVTVGALLIGCLITAVGYGVTTLQTYMYTSRFPRDPAYLKIIVSVLFILDTAHVALSWHAIYHYLVLNFGNYEALKNSVWSFNVTIILTTIITVIVHCFFARRVYILGNGNWFLTSLIIVLSIVRMIFGCYVSAQIFILKNLETLPFTLSPYVGTGLSAGTLADFIVTGSLVYYLRRHKTGFMYVPDPRPMQMLIVADKIVFWTLNNGFLTSIVGLTVIVTFSTMPKNMVFLAVHLFLSKLYANSLLGTLNFRKTHAGRGLYDDPTTIGTLHIPGLSMPQFTIGHGRRVQDNTDTALDFQYVPGPVPIELKIRGHGAARAAVAVGDRSGTAPDSDGSVVAWPLMDPESGADAQSSAAARPRSWTETSGTNASARSKSNEKLTRTSSLCSQENVRKRPGADNGSVS